MKVQSRYERLLICTIIARTENLTNRSPANLSAEWFGHNVAYLFNKTRFSNCADVDLDSVADNRDRFVDTSFTLLEVFALP